MSYKQCIRSRSFRVRCGFGIMLAILAPEAASGQVQGYVTEEEGAPVAWAKIELRKGAEVIAGAVSELSGKFVIHAPLTGVDHSLVISRIGYDSATIPLPQRSEHVIIVLNRVPIRMAALVVEATSQCPHSPDSNARGIWEKFASRYSTVTGSRAVALRVLQLERGLLPEHQLTPSPLERMRPARFAFAGSAPLGTNGRYEDVNDRIRRNGYASRTGMADPGWRLELLDGRHAHHFASAEFGRRHTFTMIRHGADHLVAFCPISREQPAIEGVLRITVDFRLLEASIQYDSRRTGFRAGADITFADVADEAGGLPHLMPATSHAWQESSTWRGRFNDRTTIYLDWVVKPTGELVPRRSPDDG